MKHTYSIENISQYNADLQVKTLHPLVTVIDFSKVPSRDWQDVPSILFQYGMYCIFLKEVKCGDIKYGRQTYDYQEGTFVFFAPGQVTEIQKPTEPVKSQGYGLVFHSDFLIGTALGKHIQDYKFFDYETNEALHLSEDERKMIIDCFLNVEHELKQTIDKHSKKLIAANIELLLDYCQRFYDRQFITRDVVHKGVLEKFEALLNAYYSSEKPQSLGLPTVAYFAEQLHLSSNYFGDLIKKETGQSPKDYIQERTIMLAKKVVMETTKTINEVAFELGFKYPQHFTRLFKQKVGVTPNEYRAMQH